MEGTNSIIQSTTSRQKNFRIRNIAILSIVSLAIILSTIMITLLVDRALNPRNENSSNVATNSDYLLEKDEENIQEENLETLFNENDIWIGNNSYPSEVAGILVRDTYPITCGDIYSGSGSSDGSVEYDYNYIDDSGKTISQRLTNRRMIGVLEELNSENNRNVFLISECEYKNRENNFQYIYLYQYCNERCGGGIGAIQSVAFYKNSELQTIEVKNTTGPYGQCFNPLALTNQDKLYLECGAGDGGFSASEIYMFDLDNISSQSISRVENSVDLP